MVNKIQLKQAIFIIFNIIFVIYTNKGELNENLFRFGSWG